MWKLTIEDDEQKQISLPLVHNDYGVGRDESNEIRLTERNISRKHTALKRNAEGWVVRDLESYNGTFVNGLRVAGEQHVAHGDILQLGDYRLEFVDEGRLMPAVPEQPTSATPAPLPAHHRPDRLVVVVGPQPGQEFYLDREHFSMGRSEDADISVNHSSVSRFHAEIFAVGNGRYEIIDKGSANGIRINGQEVRRGFIEAGDALELGDVRLRFVGAGKIFRAGFDRSQALPVVTGFDAAMKSAKPPATSSSILKMVGVGALLGVVGVGAAAIYVATRPDKPDVTASGEPSGEDAGKKLLEESKLLHEKGELEKAHEKIGQIQPGSPALKDPLIHKIEGDWADKLFKEADVEGLAEEKRNELLWRIATTPTVDEGRRRDASKKLKDVGIDVPEEVEKIKPNTPVPTRNSSWVPPPPRPSATSSAKPMGSTGDRRALDAPKATMADLRGRIGSLNATEARTLIGLCQEAGDFTCAANASKRLKDVQSGPAPSSKP